MIGSYTNELPIGELADAPQRVLGTSASDATLHYCSPAHGGWGIVRTALLVPDSYVLFVCPAACGRHGAIAAIEQGYKDRVGYLCINENEIVLGGYEQEIRRGADEIMQRVHPRPQALIICVSCIDDLLGTDHEAALAEMEAAYGVPVRLARMNPITLDSKLPPSHRIQRTMYEFLAPAPDCDRGVILLGSFRAPALDSELGRFLEACGHGPLRHPGLSENFAEFQSFSRSAAALLLRPEGTAAACDIDARLGIPSLAAPIAFSAGTVRERYRAIATFLDGLDGGGNPSQAGIPAAAERLLRDEAEAARAAAERARVALDGARVAVDSTATASPFDLALALVESGVNVVRVYAAKLPAHEASSFNLLARRKPDLIVANPSHARNHAGRPQRPLADVAIGLAAGYASMAPITIPLVFDERMYGFEGYRMVLNAVLAAVESGSADLERQIRDYGLVI